MQLEDIIPRLKAREKEAQDKKADQVRHQWGVAVAMSELQADPRWAVYGNHLKALQEDEETKIKNYQARLSGRNFLTPEVYGQLKVDLAEAQGKVAAYEQSLNLAKQLVERGELAMEEKESS